MCPFSSIVLFDFGSRGETIPDHTAQSSLDKDSDPETNLTLECPSQLTVCFLFLIFLHLHLLICYDFSLSASFSSLVVDGEKKRIGDTEATFFHTKAGHGYHLDIMHILQLSFILFYFKPVLKNNSPLTVEEIHQSTFSSHSSLFTPFSLFAKKVKGHLQYTCEM